MAASIHGSRKRTVGLLAALALVAAIALPAWADVELSDDGPYDRGGDTIRVWGDGSYPLVFPGTVNAVAVVVCNISGATTPQELGERCDADSGPSTFTSLTVFEDIPDGGVDVTVQLGPWADTDFTVNPPGDPETETTCQDEDEIGDQCAFVVSFYEEQIMGPPIWRGAEAVPFLFEAAP